MPLVKQSLGVLLLLFGLANCGGTGQGAPLFDSNLLLPRPTTISAAGPNGVVSQTTYAQTATTDGSAITTVYLPKSCQDTSSPMTKTTRNDCIYALKAIIDDKYRNYRLGLHHLVNGGNTAADVTGIGLGLAGTITPGQAAKTLLAAIGTAVAGAKTTIDADFLYKQSIEMVINQMDADRDAQFAVMVTEMNGDIDTYGFNEAMDDLLKYYSYGTWDHAITSLQTATAAKANACEAALTNAKVAKATGTTANTPACNAPAGQ